MKALIHKLESFKGKQVIDCIYEIASIADGYSINVMDPDFNGPPIDNDPHRLNVRTGKDSVITSFTIG